MGMISKVGIIGYGNMGTAICERIKNEYKLFVFDKDTSKVKAAQGLSVVKSIAEAVASSEIVILAVKPQNFTEVLDELKEAPKGKLIISIAAGISTSYIEKHLGVVRVVRVMPNIGSKIGESVTCLCAGAFATDMDVAASREILFHLGVVKEIKEGLMNAATAISGSGPAYVFEDMRKNLVDPDNMPAQRKQDYTTRLARAAETVGFSADEALYLAVNTVNASLDLVRKTGLSVAELKSMVASRGGTTEAALEVLDKSGSWEEAALAALSRAEELSKKSMGL